MNGTAPQDDPLMNAPAGPAPASAVGRSGTLPRVRVLLAAVLLLLAAGHALVVLPPADWDYPGRQVLAVLDLGAERSVGTWVNSLLHLACAVLSGALAVLARRTGRRWSANWWLLAALFAAMSVDEVAAFHDRTHAPLREALGTTGVLHFAWVIPALVVGALFLAVQVRFLRHLAQPTGRDLVLAGAVFVLGAAGLEMAEGWLASEGQRESMLFVLLIMLEELMEIGALMWVAAGILPRHLVREHGMPRITFESLTAGPTRAPGSSPVSGPVARPSGHDRVLAGTGRHAQRASLLRMGRAPHHP